LSHSISFALIRASNTVRGLSKDFTEQERIAGARAVVDELLSHFRVGPILLKKDFREGLRAILIQYQARMRNLDSKVHLARFDRFKF
jgi:hypothetical protein